MPWVRNEGYTPNTSEEKVFVKYRCGLVSKAAYPVRGKGAQRWDLRGDDFDIIGFYEPDQRQENAA